MDLPPAADAELDLTCWTCGGPYRLAWDPGPPADNLWHCPHCGAAHQSSLPGVVTDVVRRPKPH